MKQTLYDLSHHLTPETPVYPGDGGVAIEIVDTAREPTADSERRLNVGRLSLGLHNGTHIDAPFHFYSDRATIDSVPLERCCGPAVWLDLSQSVQPGIIDAIDLQPHVSTMGARKKVLISTGWDEHWGTSDYFSAHPVLTREAADWLVDVGIDLVGVDFPSVDLPPFPAHVVLLGNDVLIVENLTRLSALGSGEFSFYSIPLGIVGRDASPVRAFAIKSDP